MAPDNSGIDNANIKDPDPYVALHVKPARACSCCNQMLKKAGDIRLTVSSPGLKMQS